MAVDELFRKLRAALDFAGVPYMITGSFVSAIHGVPRATHDIDVVIAPTVHQLDNLIKYFSESDYYADIDDALEALRHHSQFNVIDEHGVWKIDFIIRKDRPFSIAEFARRRLTTILGISLYAATPEDILLAKLELAKLGDSERQLRDASGVIAIQGEALDRPYVERWVAALDLENEWAKAKAFASG